MSVFEKIKAEVDFKTGVTRLYSYLRISRTGKNYRMKFPFHDDGDPSFVLYSRGGFCFGCGWSGDLISFVAAVECCSPLDAARKIAQAFNIPMDRPPTSRGLPGRTRRSGTGCT